MDQCKLAGHNLYVRYQVGATSLNSQLQSSTRIQKNQSIQVSLHHKHPFLRSVWLLSLYLIDEQLLDDQTSLKSLMGSLEQPICCRYTSSLL